MVRPIITRPEPLAAVFLTEHEVAELLTSRSWHHLRGRQATACPPGHDSGVPSPDAPQPKRVESVDVHLLKDASSC